jgi:hypothetical protein
MRPFERLDEGDQKIVRHQVSKFMKYCGKVIPSIPNTTRAPATMEQQENGWGYNEREHKTPGHVAAPKQTKWGVSRRWTSNIVKAQAPKVVGAADIEPKRRPELRGR